MCYLTDENSDGVADMVHFYIMDTCAGKRATGRRQGVYRQLPRPRRHTDRRRLDRPRLVGRIDGLCTKTGATVRIYVP